MNLGWSEVEVSGCEMFHSQKWISLMSMYSHAHNCTHKQWTLYTVRYMWNEITLLTLSHNEEVFWFTFLFYLPLRNPHLLTIINKMCLTWWLQNWGWSETICFFTSWVQCISACVSPACPKNPREIVSVMQCSGGDANGKEDIGSLAEMSLEWLLGPVVLEWIGPFP